MADGKLGEMLNRMRTQEQVRALGEHDDGALLRRFLADNDEAAFETLLRRHGPMVLGACRRILADGHDAEDAFQATFFLLARRASTIRNPDAVGAWLHAVASQVASRARKRRDQRNRLQVLTEFDLGRVDAGECAAAEWSELRPVLDEEVGRLPEKYRAPVVLCYLEERSNTEAAEQLGWPVGTVKGRLARARSLLQTRLARRGVALAAGLFTTAGGSRAALGAAVPPSLGTATVHQALRIATGATPASAGLSPAVAALYHGGLLTMNVARIRFVGALLALFGVCAFSGDFTFRALAGRDSDRPAVSKAPVRPGTQDVTKKPAPKGSTEPAGVPLQARLIGARKSYPLDLGGLSAEEFRKKIAELKGGPGRPGRPGIGGPAFPPSPAVGLKLELTNTGKDPLKVQYDGNAHKLTLDLKGPGVVYAPIRIQNFLPIRRPPKTVTIAPGKSAVIAEVPTLAFPKPAVGSQAYWTAPGEYTLTVDYLVGVSPAPRGSRDSGDGFGFVTVRSVPLTLKVEAKK